MRINSPKCSFFRVARWFGFMNLFTEKKIHSNMLCFTQKWVTHWYFQFLVFTFWNLSPEIKLFLHFGQFYFFNRQVCNKWFITDTLTLNGFTRNAKHVFNFWKWSNLACNSSSSLTIYFSILPLCGLQWPLRETPLFSFRHWETDRILLTMCVFENWYFSSDKKISLT